MKLSVPADYAGFEVRRDIASGRFEVATPSGSVLAAREWTWGERRRLLEACRVGGRFDRAAFVDGLCELVYSPAPVEEERRAAAGLALELFGVSDRSPRRALFEVEADLARRFGWTPQGLDAHPVRALDALVSASQTAASGASEGWTTIEVEGDER